MMGAVNERAWIERLVAGMPRSPHQANRLHESDAELLRIPGTDVTIAVTTDGVVEEITSGLYRDPYLAGWMSITVNASDLAAVGAAPLGVLVSESLPPQLSAEAIDRLQAGIRDAAVRHGIPVLGGDTNASPSLQITATAIGLVTNPYLLSRRGAKPGDRLFASGRLGLGSAFAFEQMMPAIPAESASTAFRPQARLREGQLLPRWASACMDTSDGAIATLDELMRLNGVGVRLGCATHSMLHPAALETAHGAGIPPWTMLAGPHGEFELVFTIPAHRRNGFLAAAGAMDWKPIEIGVVVAEPGFACRADDGWTTLDTERIRNLFDEVAGDPRRYLAELLSCAGSNAQNDPPNRYESMVGGGEHGSVGGARGAGC
jgi:thiamine-monophosphate kinase